MLNSLWKLPGRSARMLRLLDACRRGANRAAAWPQPAGPVLDEPPNLFAEHFDSIASGPGLWKWRHYFDIYQRHFGRFIG